jgi:hypothetical protein
MQYHYQQMSHCNCNTEKLMKIQNSKMQEKGTEEQENFQQPSTKIRDITAQRKSGPQRKPNAQSGKVRNRQSLPAGRAGRIILHNRNRTESYIIPWGHHYRYIRCSPQISAMKEKQCRNVTLVERYRLPSPSSGQLECNRLLSPSAE